MRMRILFELDPSSPLSNSCDISSTSFPAIPLNISPTWQMVSMMEVRSLERSKSAALERSKSAGSNSDSGKSDLGRSAAHARRRTKSSAITKLENMSRDNHQSFRKRNRNRSEHLHSETIHEVLN